jgi:hypothetical protein
MAHTSVMTQLLLAGGATGAVLFVLVFLVEGATRPGYNAWRQYVSELCLGQRGWVQITNFLVCGPLMLGFAVGLWQALPAGVASGWGPVWVGIFGLGLVCAGLFVGAPNTPRGILHGLAGMVVFSTLPLASFVLAWRFAGDPAWRGWALYSLVTGIVVLSLFIGTSVVANRAPQGSLVRVPIGLLQRVAILTGWSWIALLALRLLTW